MEKEKEKSVRVDFIENHQWEFSINCYQFRKFWLIHDFREFDRKSRFNDCGGGISSKHENNQCDVGIKSENKCVMDGRLADEFKQIKYVCRGKIL